MKLEFINAKGNILNLTNNTNFKLSNVDGITQVSNELAVSTIASMDGDFINNVRSIPRSIVLDLSIENNVENNIRYILKYIKPKQKSMLRMTIGEEVRIIEGVVEEISAPRYSNLVILQVTLYCSQPYWEDAEYIVQEIAENVDLFYFTDDPNDMCFFVDGEDIPISEFDLNRTQIFNNSGDVSVGLEIHIIALGRVGNPIIYKSNGEFIGVNIVLESGDELIITTIKGRKTITLNGANAINKIMKNSTWLQLEVGEEEFTIDSEDGTESNMYFNVLYKTRYV